MSAEVKTLQASGEAACAMGRDVSLGHGGGVVKTTAAITERELSSLFYSPVAYLIGFMFLFLTAILFRKWTLVPGNEASMRSLFELLAYVLIFALPLLTMGSVAQEFAGGSIETLMTAPVSDVSVVLGKFLGSFVIYLALLAATLLHLFLLWQYSPEMSGAVVFSGYLGMVLLGSLFIAIGIFFSSCTKHQILAAAGAVATLGAMTYFADLGAEYLSQAWMRNLCAYVNVMGHLSDFTKGILDTKSIVFFVSGTVFFLFLATKVMESRRWR